MKVSAEGGGFLSAALELRCSRHNRWIEIGQIEDEVIRMASSDGEVGERLLREILEIRGDDDLGSTSDGGRQYMSIVRIGKGELFDQVAVAWDQAIRDGLVDRRCLSAAAWSCRVLAGGAVTLPTIRAGSPRSSGHEPAASEPGGSSNPAGAPGK
ncbi:hypothetical protein [Thiocapsa roseopersicina]|uniref:hypothetical protein n=1 Tax=Thiocapsa roseopersicina TaxID=1058 RepID=UPI0015870311|nr:hypothetical protein [Thiocapsa roseopersicina]